MLQSLAMFLPIMRFFHFYDKNIDIYTAQWDIPFPASLCTPLSAQYVCLSATLTKKQGNRYLTSKDTQNHVIKRTPSTEREPFRSGDTTMFPRRVSVCSDERCILIKISQGAVVHVRNLADIHVQRQSVTWTIRWFGDGISLRLVFVKKTKFATNISSSERSFMQIQTKSSYLGFYQHA